MNKTESSVKNTPAVKLETEGPISEKDEVKAAERKTAKLHKNAARISKSKKS